MARVIPTKKRWLLVELAHAAIWPDIKTRPVFNAPAYSAEQQAILDHCRLDLGSKRGGDDWVPAHFALILDEARKLGLGMRQTCGLMLKSTRWPWDSSHYQ